MTDMSPSERQAWDLFLSRWWKERKFPPSREVVFLAGYEAGRASEADND